MNLCATPDCPYPAGSACTMSGCPGTQLRRVSLSTPSARGAGFSRSHPTSIDPVNTHSPQHTQVQA